MFIVWHITLILKYKMILNFNYLIEKTFNYFTIILILLMQAGCHNDENISEEIALIENQLPKNYGSNKLNQIESKNAEQKIILNKNSNNKFAVKEVEKKIHTAAANGDLDAVKSLLNSGHQINRPYNIKELYGGNPLFSAVFNGHIEVVEYLLENGAQVNIADINGDTPLDWAISKKNMELDLLLRKYGGKTSSMMK